MSLRRRLLGLPFALRAAALALLAVALARPQSGTEHVKDVSEGIAIEMVVDRSGSMGAEMEFKGERVNRLEVVKRVFAEFVEGNRKDLPGRPNDLIGMIAFARYPDTVCPLTLAHGALAHFLETVNIVKRRNEDGTAIGDALALAAARLRTAEETLRRQGGAQGDYRIRSKVIILLTDGENNAGSRAPAYAAELAAKWGIRIYAIGVGGREAVQTIQTFMGTYKVPLGRGVDEGMLKSLADKTGGQFRMAEDEESLRAVYREIDRLERTRIEAERYIDYREEFTPYALAGLGLLLLEAMLAATVLRRQP